MLNFAATPAWAAGETYTWKTTTDTSTFIGTGGQYSAPTTFTRSATSNGGATFTGTASYTCASDNSAQSGPLTITIDATNYSSNGGKPVYPTEGIVSGAAACADFTPAEIAAPNTDPTTGSSTTGAAKPACDQGSFSWIFCPVIDNISGTVSKLAIDGLTPVLKVNPITPNTTPALYSTWTHIRDFADVLFIFVFLAIIGATLLEQDLAGLNPYTIKAVYVRLVIAAILVQFSFLISGLIVDVGNVLGAGVGDLLAYVTDPSKGGPSISNYMGNLLTGSLAAIVAIGAILLVSWTIIVPYLVLLLISVLVVFLTLGARYLLIAVLIAISPLAFVAWVLPNTRDFTSDWFKFLLRLVLMYPIVIAILSFAGIVNQILPFSGSAAGSGVGALAVALVKPLITIAAFLVIPESFRLAGRGLHRAYSLINGVGNKSKGWFKDTEMYKAGMADRRDRQASSMQRLANDDRIKSFTHSNSALRRAAGKGFLTAGGLALLGAPGNPKAIQAGYNRAVAARQKTLKEFENISPVLVAEAVMASYGDRTAMAKIEREAPILTSYTKTLGGRSALIAQASASSVLGDDHVRQILKSPLASELPIVQSAIARSNFREKPHLSRIDPKTGLAGEFYGDGIKALTGSYVASSLDTGVWEAAAGARQKQPDGTVRFVRDARSRSYAGQIAKELSPTVVESNFNPASRNFASEKNRSAILQMIGNNRDILAADPNGRAILQSITRYIDDPKNADVLKDYHLNIIHLQAPATIAALNPQTNAADLAMMAGEIKSHLMSTPAGPIPTPPMPPTPGPRPTPPAGPAPTPTPGPTPTPAGPTTPTGGPTILNPGRPASLRPPHPKNRRYP